MSIDLVGSTPLAARLDPERLRDVILTYHDICDQAIARYDGRVGARAGDGLMVHFGVSNPHEDDARRATLAALAIIDAMTPLANEVAARDEATLQVRIGVHTGPVVITEIGGRTDIVGTTPNETARIESAARPGTVSVSAATHELIAKDFEFEPPRQVALRGVEAPMTTYTVTGVSSHTTRPCGSALSGRTRTLARPRRSSWARPASASRASRISSPTSRRAKAGTGSRSRRAHTTRRCPSTRS